AAAAAGLLDTLRLAGPTDNRINIVFLGDGYLAGEMKAFTDGAKADLDSIFGEAWDPTRFYVDYAGAFNAFAIKTPSHESGVSQPDLGINRDTFYKCQFGGQYSLGQCDDSAALDQVGRLMPEFDVIVMMFNRADDQRATGGQIIYLHQGSPAYILKHEIGHN